MWDFWDQTQIRYGSEQEWKWTFSMWILHRYDYEKGTHEAAFLNK